MRSESVAFRSSYESKLENNSQKLKYDAKPAQKALFSIQRYEPQQEKETVSLFGLVLARRALVDQLAMAEQLVKREEVKRRIIDRLGN